jgi:hypothetical protein
MTNINYHPNPNKNLGGEGDQGTKDSFPDIPPVNSTEDTSKRSNEPKSSIPKPTKATKVPPAGLNHHELKEKAAQKKNLEKGWNGSSNRAKKKPDRSERSNSALRRDSRTQGTDSNLAGHPPRDASRQAQDRINKTKRMSVTQQEPRAPASKNSKTSLRDKMNQHIENGKKISTNPAQVSGSQNYGLPVDNAQNKNLPRQITCPQFHNQSNHVSSKNQNFSNPSMDQHAGLNSDMAKYHQKLQNEINEQNILAQMTPDEQEAYISNQLMQLRQFDMQKNNMMGDLGINNNYKHTDDFINRYNNNYRPKNDLNSI